MTGVVILVVLTVIAVVAWWFARDRQPTSIESGISSFRKEMDALAPPDRRRRREPRSGLGPTSADAADDEWPDDRGPGGPA